MEMFKDNKYFLLFEQLVTLPSYKVVAVADCVLEESDQEHGLCDTDQEARREGEAVRVAVYTLWGRRHQGQVKRRRRRRR